MSVSKDKARRLRDLLAVALGALALQACASEWGRGVRLPPPNARHAMLEIRELHVANLTARA